MQKPEQAQHIPSADRLTSGALDLVIEEGLGSLSARSLAARVGASASAINYHFGKRDALVLNVQKLAANLSVEERRAAADQGQSLAPRWAPFSDAFTAMIQHRLSQSRGLLTLAAEFETLAGAEAAREMQLCVAKETAAEAEFWRGFARSHGVTEIETEVWSNLALGLMRTLLWESDAAARSAWISGPSTRLSRRIKREAFAPAAMIEIESDGLLSSPEPKTLAQQRIVDAALEVAAKIGVHRLTQRDVAASAGVSLAAVTYFYRRKADLISAAFAELYRQTCRAVEITINRNEDGLGAATGFDEQGYSFQVSALNALMTGAARDSGLVSIAQKLRETLGGGSALILRRRGINVDRMDAFMWSMIVMGGLQRFRFHDPRRRAHLLSDSLSQLSSLIFDE
jgi:AcrR family transcriptional regulator